MAAKTPTAPAVKTRSTGIAKKTTGAARTASTLDKTTAKRPGSAAVSPVAATGRKGALSAAVTDAAGNTSLARAASPGSAAVAAERSKETAVASVSSDKPRAKKKEQKKTKLVRDSFTFPENDYALIGSLKQRALSAGREVKKSEVLRAGLAVLDAMPLENLLKALDGVERVKTGRPAK